MLKVNEIFFSIQGESSLAGVPCIFVRLTYCNLRCTYCDTEYAFYEGTDMSLEEVLKKIGEFDCRLVEITGGEPLLQKESRELMTRLCDSGYQVMLETSGSIELHDVDPRVRKIVDIKCPTSKMDHKNKWSIVSQLSQSDEVKFVIGNREDYLWAKEVIERHRLSERVSAVLLSPVFDRMDSQGLAEWVLTDRLQRHVPNIRLQLQMHKFIWAPETRGV